MLLYCLIEPERALHSSGTALYTCAWMLAGLDQTLLYDDFQVKKHFNIERLHCQCLHRIKLEQSWFLKTQVNLCSVHGNLLGKLPQPRS